MRTLLPPIGAFCIAVLFGWITNMKVGEATLLYFIVIVWFETLQKPDRSTPPVSGKDKEGEA